MRYAEAQNLLEKAVLASKEDLTTSWSPQEVDKYHHVISILVVHVLVPQGFTDLARAFLEDSRHPTQALPLPKGFCDEAFQFITSKEEELSESAMIGAQELGEGSKSPPPFPSMLEGNQAQAKERVSPHTLSSTETRIQQLSKSVMTQFHHPKRLVRPFSIMLLLVSAVILLLRKRRAFVNTSQLSPWVLRSWELFEGALMPNSAARRLKRRN